MMEYPNKIYVSEFKDDKAHFVIVVAASDSLTARKYVKEKIGFDAEPTWLMNAVHSTIYVSDGSRPMNVQVKILSNNNFHVKTKLFMNQEFLKEFDALRKVYEHLPDPTK